MNREVNKGVELNRQTDMLPVFALLPEWEKKRIISLRFWQTSCLWKRLTFWILN